MILLKPIKLMVATTLLVFGHANASDSWQYYLKGSPANITTPTSGLLVLQGGGDWVDENYTAMAERSGYGDFVVLRASGAEEYNEHIYQICRCDSVETVVFNSRAASFDDKALSIIRNADALFIAGGDQANYVRFWKDSPVQEAINELAARSVPIGGTSAGMAVLGDFVYSAMAGESLTSAAALADPFDPNLTLARDFLDLPHLAHTVTDQHFMQRDRLGRSVTMLARLLEMGWTQDARGIAADHNTALHIDPDTGSGHVFAATGHKTPYVYFLRMTSPAEVIMPDVPLTSSDVAVYRASPGDTFNLKNWQGNGGESYTLRSVNGVLETSSTSVYGPEVAPATESTESTESAKYSNYTRDTTTDKLNQ